jgi:hypothetical protein
MSNHNPSECAIKHVFFQVSFTAPNPRVLTFNDTYAVSELLSLSTESNVDRERRSEITQLAPVVFFFFFYGLLPDYVGQKG